MAPATNFVHISTRERAMAGFRQSRGCVLVAENDEDFRELIRDTLEDVGYSVVEARNGREALRQIFARGASEIGLVITDLDMPEMSGTELIEVLSSNVSLSQIPVVVVSGSRPGDVPTAKVDGWLVKPFELDALIALVAEHASPALSAAASDRRQPRAGAI